MSSDPTSMVPAPEPVPTPGAQSPIAPTSGTAAVIDVRAQRALGLARTFALCVKGIRHRLFRSLLTLMVIVLAVAFFMYLLGSSVDARAVHAGVQAETAAVRRTPQALERWFGTPSPVVMAHRLADADAAVTAQVAAVTGLPPAEVAAAVVANRDEALLLAALDDLDAGTRAALVRKAKGRDTLVWLGDAERWTSFATALAQLRSVRLPLPAARIREVVAAREATAATVRGITERWNANAAKVRTAAAALASGAPDERPEALQAWLAGTDAGGVAKLATMLRDHGFAEATVAEVQAVQVDVRALRLRDTIAGELNTPEAITAWKKLFLTSPPLDDKLVRLDDPRAVQVLDSRHPLAELTAITESIRHERRLAQLEKALAGKVPAEGALISGRQLFLVIISFVVCMVGIANAMLMAITERFREIATMKCLGATDGYILTQFLMEAGMQGLAGGLCGLVIGLVLALLMDGIAFGGHLFAYLPLGGLAVCAVLCVLAGALLATLASIYPSWMASRMAPMDAMRIE